MHTEMKYRFLIHYTLSFIGGYLGLYAIVSRADLFGNAQTANLIGVVRDLIGRNFSDMLLRVGASHIYGCCYPYGLDPRAFFHRSSFYQYRDRYLCDPAPGILSFRNVSGCGSLPRVLCNAFPVVYLQGSRRI